MSYEIAVASSDGKVVNQHFGKATNFLIFKVEGSNFKYLKLLETQSFCNYGEHDETELLSAVEALEGSRAVLVSQIGNGAANALKSKGIDAFDVRDFIEDALKKLIKYYSDIDKSTSLETSNLE
ncbi:hydrogenase [Clostridium algoriphilum]|uniref:NifB/NifX family molybdenum-iron cluster-binding protein n=1 Tax=Clostridium algoriphilum TaxID=198347 RepID=UPI001CF5CB6B|nr:NifB/NifX family molybdenum-iron cluster-binding protein [Clostridium algoriphilum]MCB2295693.1 hydrogenase [Clostridium algoriphilum]